MKIIIKILLILFTLAVTGLSQHQNPFDTVSVVSETPKDTLAYTLRDTVITASGVDSVINYTSSDSIVYSISNRKMMLYGKGQIAYKQMKLISERIDINWDTALLNAKGVEDTSDIATVKFKGTPVMIDAGEEFKGHELLYNFKTQKGKITLAETKADEGIYYGSNVKKIKKDVLFISDGRYTTCDKPDPHFYFFSPKMKLIVRDKVIAKPIYFYISDVPVFALPFGVFPSKGGRRSGIIAPAYGENANFGRYLSHLGYYWAMSDYTDFALQTDLYISGSYLVNSNFNYKLLYYFEGGVSGTYKHFIYGEKVDPTYRIQTGYNVNIRHNQDVDPTTRVNVNFSFLSDNNFKLTNYLSEALQQTVMSNATMSKNWEGTPNSMTLNISRMQTLTNGRIDEVLPSVSFNRSQSYPFRRKKPLGELAWYEQIGYDYRAGFSNSRGKIPVTILGIKISPGTQAREVNDFRRDSRQSLSQNTNISITPKFGYFNVTPNFSFRDERSWSQFNIPKRNDVDSTLIRTTEKDFVPSGFLSTGVSTGTRLYGILQPNIFGITGFRHTLSPNLGLTYSKQVYGRNIGKKNMIANLDLSNQFEIKTKPEAPPKEENKYQLLNVSAGLSYNFAADSINFSSIRVGFRTNIGDFLNIGGGSSFNLYKFDKTANRVVNKFLVNEEGRLARMESFSISLSTSLKGEKKTTQGTPVAQDTAQEIKSGYYGMYERQEADFSIPWNLNFGWNFSEGYVPNAKSRSANINASLDFNLTENWKFRLSGNYDLIRKEISAPSVQIDRDLHCWVMNFTWVPIGTYKHFRLEIRVKASQLQDVKITKQRTTY
ncbi:MAG: putative LPS assembly protein LptD [Bacteroidota bacterium]|nr:putative LPS assembly protein LptD [Bacteroidota bacterium]